jgi:hypothetical protein
MLIGDVDPFPDTEIRQKPLGAWDGILAWRAWRSMPGCCHYLPMTV